MDKRKEIIREAVAEASLPEPQKKRRESQANILIGLAREACCFFRDPRGETFAAFEVNGHPIRVKELGGLVDLAGQGRAAVKGGDEDL